MVDAGGAEAHDGAGIRAPADAHLAPDVGQGSHALQDKASWRLAGALPRPRIARLRGCGRSGGVQLPARHVLPEGPRDAAKWDLGNVDALWTCMAETLVKCAPTSGRFVEEIVKILPVLDKTTEAKGEVVPDEFYLTGRRWRRVDSEGDCTRKPSVRQRKATLVARPYHPELAAAYAPLMGPASARAGLKGGCDVGVRCGSAEAKIRFLFSTGPAPKGCLFSSRWSK